MVKTVLVEDLIEAGKLLTEGLDRSEVETVASLWLYKPEKQEWRLVIGSPAVEREGPMKVYRAIQNVLRSSPQLKMLTLDDIWVVGARDPLVKLLRSALRTGKGISGIRFSRNRVNDQIIEDAYIYRLT